MTIAKTKFAIGPATTMAARLGTGWKKKLCLRSPSVMLSRRGSIRGASGILIAEELHVAAERDGCDFPARAVTIVKPDDFRAETDGKHQNSDPTQPGDQEMAKLVEEHHKAEDEQERDEIGGNATPQRMQMRQQIRPHNARLTPPCVPSPILNPRMPLRQFRAAVRRPSFLRYGQWRALPRQIGALPFRRGARSARG